MNQINTRKNEITIMEVWEQIQRLQEQIATMKATTECIMAVNDIDEYDGGEPVTSVKTEIAMAKIEAIKVTFSEREKTLQSLLDFYRVIYTDLSKNSSRNH